MTADLRNFLVGSWTLAAILPLLGLLACSPSGDSFESTESPDEDFVATWQGGSLTLAQVEEALPTHEGPACAAWRKKEGGGFEALLPCYREVAETLALRSILLDEIGDVDAAVEALLEEDISLHRRALLAAYYNHLAQQVEVDEAKVDAEYKAHRDDFRQPGQLQLWNIFRRHEPQHPDATVEFLHQLKTRVEAGENFSTLAREFSHSETRLRDGFVGHLVEGQLPSQLEDVAFALADGEVSEPFPVKGGAVLLMVRQPTEGFDAEPEMAKRSIRQRLVSQAVDELVAARIADRPLPRNAVVLTRDELLQALDTPKTVVLELGGERLTSEDLRRRTGLRPMDRVAELEAEAQERLHGLYRELVDRQRLYLDLLASPDAADVEWRKPVEEGVRQAAEDRLVDQRLQQAMERRVEDSPEELRRYFDDNRALFQSPLRFQLSHWKVPFGDAPAAELAQMETLRNRLTAGEIELSTAVAELGGSIEDLGWRSLEELPWDLPTKANDYLSQVPDRGFTVPFQHLDAHHLFWVAARQEPRQLRFDEAGNHLQEAFLERFSLRVFNETKTAKLTAAHFTLRQSSMHQQLIVD